MINDGDINMIIGSPPRMRERRGASPQKFGKQRITPAYAGKTFALRGRTMIRRDHPRVCGKDARIFRGYDGVAGSPPRMRERHNWRGSGTCEIRITPAYAGKTLPDIAKNGTARDHPRVCGKDF